MFFTLMSAIAIVAVILMGFMRKPYKHECKSEDGPKLSFLNNIKKTLLILFSKKMLRFWPQCLWSGGSIAFWSGMLTPIMTVQMKQDHPDWKEEAYLYRCLYALILFGIGEGVVGTIMGSIIDKFTLKKTILVNLFNVWVCIGCTTLAILRLKFDWISHVLCLLWGI